MSLSQNKAVFYLKNLSVENLRNAVSYLRFLYEQDFPLDDFDYELAKRADEDDNFETISFGDAMNEAGLSYEELQN